MANRKVVPSLKKHTKCFSISRKNIDGLKEICEFRNDNPSEIVDTLIETYLKQEDI